MSCRANAKNETRNRTVCGEEERSLSQWRRTCKHCLASSNHRTGSVARSSIPTTTPSSQKQIIRRKLHATPRPLFERACAAAR
eukprot:5402168-Prymnesium_polylepis.1